MIQRLQNIYSNLSSLVFNLLKTRRALLMLGLYILTTPLLGQEQGHYMIRNYKPSEYNSFVQNWDAIQDNRGVMYFANGNGVLRYDGSEWQLIKASNNSTIRSLAKDNNGKIYAGGIGDFGYLEAGINGKTNFVSLADKLQGEDKNFLEVWFTQTVGNDTYFSTYNTLFRYRNGQIKTWKTQNECLSCFVINKQLYIYEFNSGIKRVIEDSLVLVPYSDFFKNKPFRLVIPYENNKILVASGGNGIYVFDFDAIISGNRDLVVKRLKTDVDDLVLRSFPYKGVRLNDGSFALSLIPNGLVVIDKKGKRTQLINQESGLQAESVTSIYQDIESNLWLSLAKGISKISINSPLTFWDEKSGLGLINCITRFDKSIYIGCLNGLFKLEGNSFVKKSKFDESIFSILNFKIPSDTSKQILICGTEYYGILEIQNDKIVRLLPCKSISYVLYQSKINPSYLYIGQSGHLEVARYEHGRLSHYGFVEGVKGEVRDILEESDGTIWCTNQTNQAICLKPSGNILKPKSIIEYGKEEGISGYHQIFSVNNQIFLGAETGILALNSEKNRFVPDSSFGKMFYDKSVSNVGFNRPDKTNRIWIIGTKNKHIGVALKGQSNRYNWYETPFKSISEPDGVGSFIEKDSTIWLITREELFRFKGELAPSQPSFLTVIKKAVINRDITLYPDSGVLQQDNESKSNAFLKKLPYKNNSIKFYFTALTFYNESSTQFQTYLDGFDHEWTNWTSDSKKEYTNLMEGNYVFHVRAKNLYDKIGNEAIYCFSITPPWYRTYWAYLMYFILSVLLIIVVINGYTRRLKIANIKLERIVAQRTLEIQRQRDELLVLNSTKDKFFNIIAHDLRNPFNSILGITDLAITKLKKGDTKTSLDFLEILNKTSASAYELLENLLTWSRSQSGVIQFKPDTFNIKKLIDSCILLHQGAAQIKGIALASNLSTDFFVFADKNMILTVLRNLLANAIKFSNEGDSVSVDAYESDGFIVVQVLDTGVGINENNIKKLFKIDGNVKTPGTANEPGTGLGLILCKEFVEYNRGKIFIESTEGEGSCFSFTLPVTS